MQEDSCPDYMIKAEDCLKQEEERVTNYLHMDTKSKLLKEVEMEILEHYEHELLEKEHSGAAALMRDDKVLTSADVRALTLQMGLLVELETLRLLLRIVLALPPPQMV